MKREIHYLNTDLDIAGRECVEPLAAALSTKGIFTLHIVQREDGCWHATFETDEQFREPEPNIVTFLNAIEALDDDSQRLWQACTNREFNVGYDCGDEPWAFNHALAAPTLARIAALNVVLRITLYPSEFTTSEPPEAT